MSKKSSKHGNSIIPVYIFLILSVTLLWCSISGIVFSAVTTNAYSLNYDEAFVQFFKPFVSGISYNCALEIQEEQNYTTVTNQKVSEYQNSNIGLEFKRYKNSDNNTTVKQTPTYNSDNNIFEEKYYYIRPYSTSYEIELCTSHTYFSGDSSQVYIVEIHLSIDKNFPYDDIYSDMNNLFVFLYEGRYVFIIFAVISLSFVIFCILYLCKVFSKGNVTASRIDSFTGRLSVVLILAAGIIPAGILGFLYYRMLFYYLSMSYKTFRGGIFAVSLLMSVIIGLSIAFPIYEITKRIARKDSVKNFFAAGHNNFGVKSKGIIIGIYIAVIFGILCVIGFKIHPAFIICGIIILFMLWICFICKISKIADTIKNYTNGEWDSGIKGTPLIVDDIYDNLGLISTAMKTTVEKSIRDERTKAELITNVSHDIKTPLTSIINYTDLLSRQDITQEQRTQYLETLSRNSAKMKKLIEDLIEASKASTGNIELHISNCNVRTLVSQSIAEHSHNAALRNLKIVCSESDDEAVISADGSKLYRVFDNLLVNACKYSLAGSRIYVNIVSEDDIKIIFKNISEEEISISPEELTERFVRGDISRNSDGNGLGLAIAKNLTELMHGSFVIDIDGDQFKVTLTFPKVNDSDME